MKQVVTLPRVALASSSAREQLNRVEAHHRALDTRLKELGRRVYLTPPEEREALEIKKHKLKAKDEIAALRRLIS